MSSAPLLIVMRGIPGAGKSTYAAGIPGAVVIGPDAIMDRDPGGWSWDETRWREAVGESERLLSEAIRSGCSPIVYDRCNIRWGSYAGVVLEARRAGYRVEVHQLRADPEEATRRGVHGVPLEKARAMAEALEALGLPSLVELVEVGS